MKKSYDLEKNIIEQAKTAAVKIEGEEERKRAYALSIAALSLTKILKAENIDVSTKFSLFKIPSFAQNFEFADIYADDVRIDVRITFGGDKFYIPKSHKKYEAEPDFYAVVKLDSKLSKIEPLGFVAPSELNSSVSNDEYYVYETSVLTPFKNLKKALKEVVPSQYAFSKSEHEKINELCAAFFDSQINESEKIFFIKHIVNCSDCREKISEFNEFEIIINQAKNYPDLLDDNTLSILSGAYANEPQEEEVQNDGILESEISSSMFEIVKDITETASDAAVIAADTAAATVSGLAAEAAIAEIAEDTAESMLDLVSDEGSLDDLFAVDESEENEEPEVSEQNEPEEEIEESVEEPTEEPAEESVEEIEFGDITELSDLSEDSVEADIAELETPIEDVIEETATESVEETVAEPAEETEVVESFDLEPSEGLELDDLGALDGGEEEFLLEEHEEPAESELIEETADAAEVEELQEPQEIKEVEDIAETSEEDGISLIEEEPEMLLEDIQEETEEAIFEEPQDVISEELPYEELPSEEPIAEELTDEPDDTLLQADDLDSLDEITEEPETPAYSGIELIDEDETPTEYNAPVQEEPAYEGIEMIDEEEPTEEPVAEIAAEVEETPAEATEINPEIQNLLDDELLQLLSSDDSDTPQMPQEDAVAGMDEETLTVEESDSEIETLYENNPEMQENEEGEAVLDLSKEPISAKTAGMTKKIVMAAILLFVVAAGGLTALYLKFNKPSDNTAMLPDLNDQTQSGLPLEGATNAPSDSSQPEPAMSQDLNKSMTNVFSEQPAAVTITKISWEVSQKLAADPTFKNYLQVAGKNLQMNLQNDLSYTTDFNFNNKVKVSMEIGKDNTIKRIQATESSGSEQIDNVVLQSIKETLKYINVPDIKDYNGNYNLSVVINF